MQAGSLRNSKNQAMYAGYKRSFRPKGQGFNQQGIGYKMTDRMYRSLLGSLLLAALLFDLNLLMYFLITLLLLEGLTNWRIPLLINGLRRAPSNSAPVTKCHYYRYQFEAERAWRLLIGSLLGVTYIFFYQSLWFIPWFLGFAIVGAGASGICPMEFSLKRIGLK